jgi:iron complex outermembrane receptor protein
MSEWTVGPYLTARFSPLPNLAFSAGTRFDMAVIDAKKKTTNIADDKSYTALVYEGSIVFNPLNDLKLYAKYSSLFRYPFVDELAQVSGYKDKFNAGLKPETGFNAEAGTSYKLGKILDINANFFFMDLEDEICYNNTTNANENLNKTRRLGTNAGLAFSPVSFVSLGAAYSFVDAVFMSGDNKNKYVPLVPAHKIYGNITIKLPFGLDFGPDLEYTSGAYYGEDYANEGEMLDSWFLLGARLRYVFKKEGRQLAVQINAKNLLNTHYASYGTAFFDEYVPVPVWKYTLYPADGRSINVSMQYRF